MISEWKFFLVSTRPFPRCEAIIVRPSAGVSWDRQWRRIYRYVDCRGILLPGQVRVAGALEWEGVVHTTCLQQQLNQHRSVMPTTTQSRHSDRNSMPFTLDRLSTLCLKKVPTFKLSVTLSNLNRFSKFLHCWRAYEICYKSTSVATCLGWGG